MRRSLPLTQYGLIALFVSACSVPPNHQRSVSLRQWHTTSVPVADEPSLQPCVDRCRSGYGPRRGEGASVFATSQTECDVAVPGSTFLPGRLSCELTGSVAFAACLRTCPDAVTADGRCGEAPAGAECIEVARTVDGPRIEDGTCLDWPDRRASGPGLEVRCWDLARRRGARPRDGGFGEGGSGADPVAVTLITVGAVLIGLLIVDAACDKGCFGTPR
jgi:hypothetical protein